MYCLSLANDHAERRSEFANRSLAPDAIPFELLAQGAADLCGMTRALICDPELPRKAREGRLDEMEIKVEARPDVFDGSMHATAARELSHLVKSNIGVSSRVTILPPGGIERSLGKARRVIDKRPREG